ncbi:hypothetical protein TB2_006183 [Malus domestica]
MAQSQSGQPPSSASDPEPDDPCFLSTHTIPNQNPKLLHLSFDCVLHKLYVDDWKWELAEFSVKKPDEVIIDVPEAIERLHNQTSMLQVVSELRIKIYGSR